MDLEFQRFLTENPLVASVDLLLPDINGVLRGKRIPVEKIPALYRRELMIPRATVLLDTHGRASDAIAYGYQDGDPDGAIQAVERTLVVADAEKTTAQVMCQVGDVDDKPWDFNPAIVLQRVLDRFSKLKLRPVIAIELEFHLLKFSAKKAIPASAPDALPDAVGPQTYNLDHLDDYSDFLSELESVLALQGLSTISILTEFGEGQFEVNLPHSDNVALVCHHALMLKRAVRRVALKHQLQATFMAKPIAADAGNGLHVHLSLCDEHNRKVFCSDSRSYSCELNQVIAGCLDLMPESVAVFCPNANSYRRFDPDNFAPMVANWGEDHRAVAIRIPRSTAENTRIEHRVAGADANPFLVVASILSAAAHGLSERLQAPEPALVSSQVQSTGASSAIPLRWSTALEAFRGAKVLPSYLGDEFCELFYMIKRDEEQFLHSQRVAADYKDYVRTL